MNPFLQILYAAIGTLGFCLFFRVRKRSWIPATVCGAATWALYLLLSGLGLHIFLCSFGASLLAAVAAEFLARFQKTPSLVFYIPGIVPLVPGSSLYYMMQAMVRSDYAQAGEKAFVLLWTMLGIGAGSAFTIGFMEIRNRLKNMNHRSTI